MRRTAHRTAGIAAPLAYQADGRSLTANGVARRVVPGDAKAGRFVANRVKPQVFSAATVPEPANAVPLLAGPGALAFARTARHARP